MKGRLLPLGAGALFAAGLAISGMTQAAKVVGFLDFLGAWDPSLAFVMLGAAGVYMLAYRQGALKMRHPFWAERFSFPTHTKVDVPLLVGAAAFGVGWGMSGFCPGPSLVDFGAGLSSTLWFVPATLAGMALHQVVSRERTA